MAIQTLRPNGTQLANGWTVSSGTLHGNTSDDSDATVATSPGNGKAMELNLTSYTLLAGERVKRLRIRARGSSATGQTLTSMCQVEGTPPLATAILTAVLGSIATHTGGWDNLSGVAPQGSVDSLLMDARDGGGTLSVAELYVDLDVWQRTDAPTVSTDPAGSGGPPPIITDTDVPTVESYTAALNDGTPSLYSRQVRVFRDAVYLAGGFDPETEPDVEWEQTDTSLGSISTDSGSPDTVQVDEPLANSDTYRAYVRYGKNDVAGSTLWSEWGHVEFTLNLTLPTAPTVDVTVDEHAGRQTVEITTAALTHDTLERIRLHRSDDGGTTWATVRDGLLTEDPDTGAALTGATTYTFHDYDAPRGTVLQYRARVTEGITASGTTLTSAWTTTDTLAHPNDGRWWLYDVDRWTAVHGGARIAAGPEIDVDADVGVFRPLDLEGASVVVTGASHGDDGAYTLRATGTDECATADAIARFTGTVLVKSPFGDQKYVRWTGRRRVLAGVPTEPRHQWTLDYTEVEPDIGADG